MWTAVYVATGLENAEKIKKRLTEEGFLIRIKYFSQGGNEELYEILAPEIESEEVQEALYDLGLI